MTQIDRRTALVGMGLGAVLPAAGALGLTKRAFGYDDHTGEYTLPELGYAYDALEPHIDTETMRIHHSKHHAGYVRGLNTALAKLAEARDSGDTALVKHWSRELAFHGSGHVNHVLFWSGMTPDGPDSPTAPLAAAIERDFGSFDRFRAHFVAASGKVEGSGWGFLAYEPLGGRLVVLQAEKHQDTTVLGMVPLLGVDVWEHAYYLKYQNRRSEYVEAFLNVVDWAEIGRRYAAAAG